MSVFSHQPSAVTTTPLFLTRSNDMQKNVMHIWKVNKMFLPLLCYFKSPLRSSRLPLLSSVGYMWACLHDQRNAKSSPDHYNMPCVHNLHEIHIHSWHVCTRSSFSPSPSFPSRLSCALFLRLCAQDVFFSLKVFTWKLCVSSLFLYVLPFVILIIPINALGSHHVAWCCSKNEQTAVHFKKKKKKKKRGSTSFAPEREFMREGNVSLAPML